jgi:RNA polymerase sigma factor (sigma-70 family)
MPLQLLECSDRGVRSSVQAELCSPTQRATPPTPPATDVVLVQPDQGSADLSEARDRDLVRRIRGGDEDAFRRLFRRYAPTALGLARRVVRQPHLAEETVQEAFLSVWRNAASFDEGRGSVRAWLMGAVHNRAVDAVRREEAQRRRAEDAASDPGLEPLDPGDTVVEEVGIDQERTAVRAALGKLPSEQRQVIELMYFGGQSQSRIAKRLGLPLGTVKSRMLLGMRRLRAELLGMER